MQLDSPPEGRRGRRRRGGAPLKAPSNQSSQAMATGEEKLSSAARPLQSLLGDTARPPGSDDGRTGSSNDADREDWGSAGPNPGASGQMDASSSVDAGVPEMQVPCSLPSTPAEYMEVIVTQMEGQGRALDADCSPEERACNLQEQEDEVEALRSIYGEEFVELERPEASAARAFMITVNVDFAAPLTVVASLSDDSAGSSLATSRSLSMVDGPTGAGAPKGTSEAVATSAEEELDPSLDASSRAGGQTSPSRQPLSTSPCPSAEFAVDLLPPLQLLCVLPPSYPSLSPPHFRLSCRWLSGRQLSRLCRSLDEVWQECQGQVVVFSWVDWLRESFSHLGLEGPLQLESRRLTNSDTGGGEDFDRRAMPEMLAVEELVPLLMRWNQEKKDDVFRQEIRCCQICFVEQPGSEFAQLPCGHSFCCNCTRTMAEGQVADGAVTKINCPDTTCRRAVPVGVLRDLLPVAAFARWEALTLQRSLDSMEDLVYCPRCNVACLEDSEGDNHAQCGACFYSFCGLCRSNWHAGQPCMDAEARLRILQERRKGREAGQDQAAREADLLNEVRSLQAITRDSRRCPRCGMAISKIEGCNKMTCSQCQSYFCYRCGKGIDGYDHFRAGSCVLFEQEEVRRWEAMIQGPIMQEAGQFALAAVEMWPERRRSCPACRQQNIKRDNNNHILCWACRNHFCGLCGKLVRNSSEHYGRTKCRQHS